MTFTSNIFLIGLLPWFIIMYAICRKKVNARRVLLLLANTLFYIWCGIGSFFVICLISIITWGFCKICQNRKNKAIFGLGCMIVLMPLLAFKYIAFIIENTNIESSTWLMPIGISFFTFEAISCLCDVYKNRITEKVSLLEMYLYLSFFPTVTSGPIVRISDFKNGLKKEIDFGNYSSNIERIALGLIKKVLIADKVAVLADYYFNGIAAGTSYSSLGLWIGSIAYSLQLYFDFSGYSDMAIGIGNLLGFRIPENFNKPYQARSIQDFWKRWHISLSQWFRDYVYIPLGGNRCSAPKHILNLLIVWFLTGIWHGADWSFVIWGIGYFALLIIEKYIPFMKKISNKWYGHIYALFFINLLWIPFRAENLTVASKYIIEMLGGGHVKGIEDKALSYLPFLVVVVTVCFPWDRLFSKYNERIWFSVMKNIAMLVLAFLAICAVVNSSYTPYIYGNF